MMGQEEVRKLVDSGDIVIGSEEVEKLMNNSDLDKVFLASNAPDDVKSDMERYSNISGVEVEELEMLNDELGVLCRKPFPVSAIGKRK